MINQSNIKKLRYRRIKNNNITCNNLPVVEKPWIPKFKMKIKHVQSTFLVLKTFKGD